MVAGAGGRKKAGPAKPPEKGSFPLDHGGECKPQADTFKKCMSEHGSRHAPCKSIAKLYFECCMNKNLMAQEDLSTMGFSVEQTNRMNEAEANVDQMDQARSKYKKEGYVAGLRAKGYLPNEKNKNKNKKYYDSKSSVPSHLREGTGKRL